MISNEQINQSLENYKNLEIQLHRELMNSCRKYITRLNIVSIVGIIELLKQETIELEKATKKNIEHEDDYKNPSIDNNSYSTL